MSDWEQLKKLAERQGWQVERTKRGHYKWFAPDNHTIIVSGSTISDHRAIKNQKARMRRAGFNG